MNRALFLDRDGVINREINYLHKIDDFVFIDGVFETCRFFQNRDYLIIVITNQAGIGRGYYSEEDFHRLNNWMVEEFSKEGIKISAVYFCPHHPESGVGDYKRECQCRKPEPGMVLEAKSRFNLNLEKSLLVGDKESDVLCGINAGVGKNYLVRTGHAIDESTSRADKIFDSIVELISLI